jgi:hypothetical protein
MKKIIILSISITLGISTLAGLATWLAGFMFWPTFIVTLLMQIMAGLISNKRFEIASKRHYDIINEQVELVRSIQSVNLACAHCNAINLVTLNINSENRFTCFECTKPNTVIINFNVVRATTFVEPQAVIDKMYEVASAKLEAKS